LFLLLVSPCCYASKTADSLLLQAEHCFEKGDYDQMLILALDALKLNENRSCEEKTLGYLKVGRAYYHLQQKPLAVQYLLKVSQMAATCKLDSFERVSYRQLGGVFFELGKKDSSIYYLDKAEAMLRNTQHWAELSSLYAIRGEWYKGEAIGKKYFDMALDYAYKSKDTVAIAFAEIKQGMYYTTANKCKEAIAAFTSALAHYQCAKLVEGEMYALQALAWAHSECGNARETFQILVKVRAIRDSIFKHETAENIARYRTLYETEKKEKENVTLALQVEQDARDRRMLLASFSIAILLISICFLVFYSRYKLKKQKEADQQMADQQQLRFAAVIEAEEKERKRIACDLHDGIGQTISAAKINLSLLQAEMEFASGEQRDTFEKVLALVDESCREVRNVSHSMMPNALLKWGLGTAIRNFMHRINSKVLNVDYYSEGLDTSLDPNKEVVLYRVIQECVNNVIKHSAATKLYVALIRDEDEISVTIEDNGKGFDIHDKEKFEGIGLRNVQSRINFLNGTVEWDSTPGKGTVVIINIPL
jgi:two-component system NarL family sensor kinase